ncbi:MAG: TlpA family protein disulfide reductase [Magnetospirillum sp.]|nr:TlpA family protein disulfide reductase [Magnetospirillum sp.]
MILGRRQVLTAALAAALVRPALAAAVKGLQVAPAPLPLAALPITDADGRMVGLTDLAGRPGLVNLWASWCGPCVAELPALDRLAASQSRVGVLTLCLDRGGAPTARAAFERMSIQALPLRLDPERRAATVWNVPVLPTTLFLDAQGREVGRFIGAARWDTPDAMLLLSALAEGRPLGLEMAPPPVTMTIQ